MTPSTATKENNTEPAAIRTWVNGRLIYIELTDGRIIGFPADRFKLLSQATDEQLTRVQLRLNGFPEPFFPPFSTAPGITRSTLKSSVFYGNSSDGQAGCEDVK